MADKDLLICDWPDVDRTEFIGIPAIVADWRRIGGRLGIEPQAVITAVGQGPPPTNRILAATLGLRIKGRACTKENLVLAFGELKGLTKKLPAAEPKDWTAKDIDQFADAASGHWERIASYVGVDPQDVRSDVTLGATEIQLSNMLWQILIQQGQVRSSQVVATLQPELAAYVDKVPRKHPVELSKASTNRKPDVKKPSEFDFVEPVKYASKTALVIGVGGYLNINPLVNPPRDARDIDKALRARGFTVTLVLEPTANEMRAAIQTWLAAITPQDCALLFYAGHGIEVDKVNYMLPTDFDLNDCLRLPPASGVNMTETFERLVAKKPRLGLLIADACRNDPTRMLSLNTVRWTFAPMAVPTVDERTVDVPSLMIVFSTAPGKTARDADPHHPENSPFAYALKEGLATDPGAELQQLIRKITEAVVVSTSKTQVPWFGAGTIVGQHFLYE